MSKTSRYEKGTFITVPNIHILWGMKSFEQSVYLWICNHSDERGICFPSRTTLAKEAGCSVRSVDQAIAEFERAGILEKIQRIDHNNRNRNLTNIYQLLIAEQDGTRIKPGQPVQVVQEGGAGGALGGGAGGAQRTKPILSNQTQLKAKTKVLGSYEVISDTPPKEKRKRKDQGVLALREKLYDLFEREKEVRPTIHEGDYVRILNALKRLDEKQILELVEDGIDNRKKKTVREALTAREVDIYLQDNA